MPSNGSRTAVPASAGVSAVKACPKPLLYNFLMKPWRIPSFLPCNYTLHLRAGYRELRKLGGINGNDVWGSKVIQFARDPTVQDVAGPTLFRMRFLGA